MTELFYSNKQVEIHCTDALQALITLDSASVQLLLTDIPYTVVNRPSNGLRLLDKGVADVCDLDLGTLIREFVRVTFGSIYVFCGTEQVSNIRQEMVNQKLSTRLCIWEKTNPSPMNGEHLWLSGIECCVFGRKKKAPFHEHCKNSVWRFPSGKRTLHPTQKPLDLFKYLITVSSDEGDLVLDPFLGSGTTAIAAMQLGRRCIGFELEEQFCEVATLRCIQEEVKLEALESNRRQPTE